MALFEWARRIKDAVLTADYSDQRRWKKTSNPISAFHCAGPDNSPPLKVNLFETEQQASCSPVIASNHQIAQIEADNNPRSIRTEILTGDCADERRWEELYQSQLPRRGSGQLASF